MLSPYRAILALALAGALAASLLPTASAGAAECITLSLKHYGEGVDADLSTNGGISLMVTTGVAGDGLTLVATVVPGVCIVDVDLRAVLSNLEQEASQTTPRAPLLP